MQPQEVINSIKDGVQKNAERSHRVFQEKVGILFEDRSGDQGVLREDHHGDELSEERQKAAQLTQSTHMYANPTVERELAVWRHGRFSYLLCSGYHSVLSPCIVCSTDLMATNSAPGSIGVPFQGLSTQGSIDAFLASTKVGSASLEG